MKTKEQNKKPQRRHIDVNTGNIEVRKIEALFNINDNIYKMVVVNQTIANLLNDLVNLKNDQEKK